jgi:putative ABC transport system substrate-binding protein
LTSSGSRFRRRAFLRHAVGLGGSTALAGLLAGCGVLDLLAPRPAAVRRIGYIVSNDRATDAAGIKAFLDGLSQAGWYEGKNLTIEWREAHSQATNYASLADELIQLPVEVIVAPSSGSVRAAAAATNKIPIVMISGGAISAEVTDPVTSGVAVNVARPEGNVTGLFAPEPVAKRLELLKVTLPNLTRVGMLHAGSGPNVQFVSEAEAAAVNLGLDLVDMPVVSPQLSSEAAFQRAVAAGAQAVAQTVVWLPLADQETHIAELALSAQLPSMFPTPTAGALMSYGINFLPGYQRLASFVDRVLRGTHPGQLPIESPTRFTFVANTTTAKILGITFPREIAVQVTRWVDR